jgi:hypothetical protein
MDERSVSKSKTPNKSERPANKKNFPTNFKKLDNLYYKGPGITTGLKNIKSSK